MKKHFIYLFSFFIAAIMSNNLMAQAEQDSIRTQYGKPVRVISYNILDGFNSLTDVPRMNNLSHWLKGKSPQIVALQELVDFKQKDLTEFAKSYGHKYSVISKETSYPLGVTSEYPIEIINILSKNLWHGMMHVKILDIDIIVVHLTPEKLGYRMNEAKIITDYIKTNKLDYYMVLGDFNSHSPFDATNIENRPKLTKRMRDGHSKRGDVVDYSVQSTFIATPMEDVCRHFTSLENRTTYPAVLDDSNSDKNKVKSDGVRIDFIYTSPTLFKKCVNAYIWNGSDVDNLSDHYPIGVDIL